MKIWVNSYKTDAIYWEVYKSDCHERLSLNILFQYRFVVLFLKEQHYHKK